MISLLRKIPEQTRRQLRRAWRKYGILWLGAILVGVVAILEKDTGSHFDPSVMDVFRTMAAKIFDRLANISESDAQQLLDDRVRQHFEL